MTQAELEADSLFRVRGTNVNFYHLRAGRLWKGEVVRVNSSGEVCGMDFATAATKTFLDV